MVCYEKIFSQEQIIASNQLPTQCHERSEKISKIVNQVFEILPKICQKN